MKKIKFATEKITNNAKNPTAALFAATQKGDATQMECAIQNGADISFHIAYNVTPMSNAVESGNVDAVKLLVKHGATVHTALQQITAWDAWHDDDTMLHLASKQGNLEMVQYLLSQGVDTSKKNYDGKTAQEVAANSQIAAVIASMCKK